MTDCTSGPKEHYTYIFRDHAENSPDIFKTFPDLNSRLSLTFQVSVNPA